MRVHLLKPRLDKHPNRRKDQRRKTGFIEFDEDERRQKHERRNFRLDGSGAPPSVKAQQNKTLKEKEAKKKKSSSPSPLDPLEEKEGEADAT